MSDNSPIYTGWLQAQLSGDVDRAKELIHEARRVLGGMLNATGVNDRAAAGEPTGFHKTHKQYPDGTRITAWHNNGHNVVRVDTPPIKVGRDEYKPTDPKGHDWQGEHHFKGGSAHHKPTGVDVPHLKTSRPEEEEEDEKNPNGYYMWVGIRTTSENVPFYATSGCMIEPTGSKIGRGVIDANEYWGSSAIEMYDGNLGTVSFNRQANFTDAISEDWDTWHEYGDGRMTYGDHCTSIILDENFSRVLASANGLLCMANDFCDEAANEDFMQYDPLAKEQTGANRPSTGDRDPRSGGFQRYIPPLRNWDVVWELDPDPFEFPGDTRHWRTTMTDALEKQCGMAAGDAKVLSGLYMLTVNIEDGVPQLRSRRAGETIPTSNLGEPLNQRSGTSDYNDYMELTKSTTNTSVQIEVRLNKGKEMTIFKFETVIVSCDDRFNVVAPFGDNFPYDDCLKEGGPNPMGPNFMQTPIAIDVMGGVADWADKFDNATVDPIFGGGHYGVPGDDRKELLLCVYGNYGVSQPDASNWAQNAAYAAWRVLEDATAGIYGQMKFKELGEGALRGIFAGGRREAVNVLNCYTGQLSTYGVIGKEDDYPYEDWDTGFGSMAPSPYSPWAFWYYPYKLIFKEQCFNTVGILVTGIDTNYGSVSGQVRYGEINGHPAEPAPPDCC